MFAVRRYAAAFIADEAALACSQLCSTSGRLLAPLTACFSSTAAHAASTVEPLAAEPRAEAGSIPAGKLRREGRVPAVVFSFPESSDVTDSKLLSLDAKVVSRIVQKQGRMGWACSLFDLQIAVPGGSEQETIRALGRQVHIRADSDGVENVTFISCPPDRLVKVDVPLQVFGEEVSPGLKAGGRLNWIRRTIPCIARGDSIPRSFEVDISQLGVNEKLLFSDLDVPQGVALRIKTHSDPIIKVAK